MYFGPLAFGQTWTQTDRHTRTGQCLFFAHYGVLVLADAGERLTCLWAGTFFVHTHARTIQPLHVCVCVCVCECVRAARVARPFCLPRASTAAIRRKKESPQRASQADRESQTRAEERARENARAFAQVRLFDGPRLSYARSSAIVDTHREEGARLACQCGSSETRAAVQTSLALVCNPRQLSRRSS